jgi:hypothetical protein
MGNGDEISMLGSKRSFSSLSVTSSVDRLRELDSNVEAELYEYPVEDIANAPENGWLGDGLFTNQDLLKQRVPLLNGIMAAILEDAFDGEAGDLDEYCKAAIIEAFNFGFGSNFGKLMYKEFVRSQAKNPRAFSIGKLWGGDYIIRHYSP